MRSVFLPDGLKFIANMLAGDTKRINGIYVEYAADEVSSVESRSQSYFDELLRSQSSGYARIPVQSVVVQDNKVTFTGLVAKSDFKGGHMGRNSKLIGATLVYMPDDVVAHDTLIYTTLFTEPVKVVKGVYTTVNVTLAIGA